MGTNPHFMDRNFLVTQNSTLSAGTTVPAFPVANIKDKRAQTVYRTTAKTGQFVRIDLQTAKTVGAVALINLNWTSSAIVKLEANSIDNFVSPAFVSTLNAGGLLKSRNLYRILASAQTFRFWRVKVDDSLNAGTALEIGEIVLGTATEFLESYDFGFRDRHERITDVKETAFGVKWAYDKSARRVFEVDWTNASEALKDQLSDLFDAVKGDVEPFIFIPDPGAAEVFMVRLDPAVTDSEPFFQIHNIGGIRFAEEVQGITIA